MHSNKKTSFTRDFVLCLIFILLSFAGVSQEAMTFNAAESQGIRLTYLDSTYKSALHSDSAKAVFWTKQDEFVGAYHGFLQSLGGFLKDKGFVWGKETKCFNRIYFNQDGRIDYFLFNFQKGELTHENETVFQVLTNLFIRDYKFPMIADTKFSQCSPVRYNDKK